MEYVNNHVILLELPSSLECVHILSAVISEITRQLKVDDETIDEVTLAVIEAGTNAIKHGNQEDPMKRARFEFTLQPDEFIAVIHDQGPGFDRGEVPDPMDEENLLKTSGRGLFLIEACMDGVTYENSGTIIRMVKHLRHRRALGAN